MKKAHEVIRDVLGGAFAGIKIDENAKVDRPPPDAPIEQVRDFALIFSMYTARIEGMRLSGDKGWFDAELHRLAFDYNLRWTRPAERQQ